VLFYALAKGERDMRILKIVLDILFGVIFYAALGIMCLGAIIYCCGCESVNSVSGEIIEDTAKDGEIEIDTGEYVCSDSDCIEPPPDDCLNPYCRRLYAAIGRCYRNECVYESTKRCCQYGCTEGVCDPTPCELLDCNNSPPAYCRDRKTLIRYPSPGTCFEGVCQYFKIETIKCECIYENKEAVCR
jgi:hypothetical protein